MDIQNDNKGGLIVRYHEDILMVFAPCTPSKFTQVLDRFHVVPKEIWSGLFGAVVSLGTLKMDLQIVIKVN